MHLGVFSFLRSGKRPLCVLRLSLFSLVQGKLPWQGLTARTREAHMEKIRKSKVDEVRLAAFD